MQKLNLSKLNKMANTIRKDIVKMLFKAGSGHPAGSLGMADVFSVLYFSGIVKHNSKKPNSSKRDRIILSNGHICPVWYSALARAGYFSVKKLETLRKFGSPLQGHPHRESLPGVENSSGPVGHSTSLAAGMAYAGKMDKKNYQVYCIEGDGGHNEGQLWEAVMFAGKYKLDNLTFIIDRNNIQIDGKTEQVMPLEPLEQKYKAFNWKVIKIDGHNIKEIIEAIREAKNFSGKPTVIIANTAPGKGVSFMENKSLWHGKAPNKSQYKKALKELEKNGK